MIIWYILLMIILYIISSIMIMMMLLIFVINFNYMMLILFEMYTILFLVMVINNSSSYERGGANVYLLFFGYVMGFGIVIVNSLILMSLLLLFLSLSNLPMYSLHIWLPNVHVEASMISSIILAGGVLNLSILYVWNFSSLIISSVIVLSSLLSLLLSIDSNLFAAISSVLHMTLCVLVGLYIMMMISYIHIILSPYMFITVYIIYITSGTRFYINNSFVIMVLWMVNFSLPIVSSFFSEVYLIIYCGMMLIILLLIYILVGYVMMNSINDMSNGVYYLPWFVLYMLIV